MTADPYTAVKDAWQKSWNRWSARDPTTPLALKLIEFAGVGVEQDVLDVGCGIGVATLSARKLGARVCGVDSESSRLEVARWRAAANGTPIDYRRASAEELPFSDNSFDVVVSQLGGIFSPDLDAVIREMLRVLRPGGRLAYSTWVPQSAIGQIIGLSEQHLPTGNMALSSELRDPARIKGHLGAVVCDIEIDVAQLDIPTSTIGNYCSSIECAVPPVTRAVLTWAYDPPRLAEYRLQMEGIVKNWFADKAIRQTFLMLRARKL